MTKGAASQATDRSTSIRSIEVRSGIVGVRSINWAIDHLVRVAGSAKSAETTIVEVRLDPSSPRDGFVLRREGDGLVVSGDERGIVYGLLELADRIACGAVPAETLVGADSEENAPSASLRSLVRYFTNRTLDYPWYSDEAFWPDFLTELATHRFGRFSLAFGLGQDYGHDHGVTDNYLSYIYPFLLDVPGFNVRARGVDESERARNLAALRHIAQETVRRGLQFNLSLWAHNYTFPDSPNLSHPIEGLDNQSWPSYSGRALRQLLDAVPEISGLTLRIHYEGGVPDDDRHRFWSVVLGELQQLNREVALEIHSKGADAPTLDLFLGSGLPLTVSTKFAGEHLTLPYHAASIRHQERAATKADGVMSVTLGARMFTRYSYGDFMRRDRDYEVSTRVWNGTQRILLWADPLFAAAMGREATFDGAKGTEVFDPLSLRGRWDTAGEATRTAYSDLSLEPERDWHKFRLFYRVWGRGLYGDNGLGAAWDRYLKHEHGANGGALGVAISAASRILPLAMSVHAAGAGNRDYWPEFYEDVPYVELPEGGGKQLRMGTVSPLDPELFYGIAEYVADDLAGTVDARYRPSEVADWFDSLASTVERKLASEKDTTDAKTRRLVADAGIQAGLGRFFAAKFRASMFVERYNLDGHPADLRAAARHAVVARDRWAAVAKLGSTVYADDIGYGRPARLSGSWATRLPEVVRNAEALVERAAGSSDDGDAPRVFLAPRDLSRTPSYRIMAPATYPIGNSAEISIDAPGASEALLHVRQVNHAETFSTRQINRSNGTTFTTQLQGVDTSGVFDLIYFISARIHGVLWLLPGFGADLSARPYVLVQGANGTP